MLLRILPLAALILGGSVTASLASAQENRTFTGTRPADWQEASAVESYIETLTPNQTIEGMVVTDPTNANVVYFATSAPDGTLSIYRYDTSIKRYERLWREDGTTDREWSVVGHANGMVIFAETGAGHEPGACGSALIDAAEGGGGARLLQLPDTFAESWSTGPTAYTAPDDVLQNARDERTQCEQSQQNTQE